MKRLMDGSEGSTGDDPVVLDDVGGASAQPDAPAAFPIVGVGASAGGLDAFSTTPEEFTALIQRDFDKYGKIVRDVGIKVD